MERPIAATWDEMCMAKKSFGIPRKRVMQLYRPKSDVRERSPLRASSLEAAEGRDPAPTQDRRGRLTLCLPNHLGEALQELPESRR